MKSPRLIAMDMDGTLLDYRSDGIPPETAETLREASRRGFHLCLCTGRLNDDAAAFARNSGLPMSIIGLNGAYITPEPFGPVSDSFPMTECSARTIHAILNDSGLLYGCFAGHLLAISDSARSNWKYWGTWLSGDQCRIRILHDFRTSGEPLPTDVHKFVVIEEKDTDALASLRTQIEQTVPGLSISASWINNIEINAPGVNKGQGLKVLADRLGITMDEVMAIGDGINDLPMMQAVGIPVAMGNAMPEVRAEARFVTRSNLQSGVAAAVRALCFGEQQEGVYPL